MQEEGNHVIDQEHVGAELQHVHQGPTATTFPSIPVVLELIPKGLPPPRRPSGPSRGRPYFAVSKDY